MVQNPGSPVLPPRHGQQSSIAESIYWASQHDPTGHRVHLCAAILFCACLPLSTAAFNISGALLYGTAIVRAWTIAPAYRSLLRHPLTLVILAWIGWMALSLSWTGDLEDGLRALRAQRMLLIPLVMLPVLGSARVLVHAFLVGCLLSFLMQCLQVTGMVDSLSSLAVPIPSGGDRYAGVHDPNTLGLAMAVGVNLTCGMFRHVRGKGLPILGVLFAVLIAGLLMTGKMSALLAAGCGLAMQGGILVVRKRTNIQAMGWVAAILGVVLAGGYLVGSPVLTGRLSEAWSDLSLTMQGKNDTGQPVDIETSSVRLRMEMWRAGGTVIRQRPLRGTGAGGIAAILPYLPRDSLLHGTRHGSLHSTWIGTTATLGFPGLLILGGLVFLLLRLAISLVREGVEVPGVLGSITVWIVISGFESSHLSGGSMALLAVLLAFVLPVVTGSSGKRSGVHAADPGRDRG